MATGAFNTFPSVTASVSHDNALAESVIGLYKAEVIHRLGPWRNSEHVEFETLDWVDWFNNRRLPGPIGHIPPAEYEASYHQFHKAPGMVAGLNPRRLRKTRGGFNAFASSFCAVGGK